jgi:tripartite-type tricarboxylate transporter receptor subunit TctC
MKRILLLLLFVASSVMAADVRFIVPFSPGGSSDQLARELELLLSNSTYKFIIEYKPGAGGAVGAEYLAKVRHETVFMTITPGLIANPIINHSSGYDVLHDFVFVSYIGSEPLIMAVNQQTKIANYKQFLTEASYKKLPYGSPGIGSSGHLSAAIIAGNNPNLFNVPYKGSASMMSDLLAGNTSWAVDSDAVLGPYIKNHSLVPIAVYGPRQLAKYPSVPTLKQLGIDDQRFYRWHIVLANSDADPAVIQYVQGRLKDTRVKSQIQQLGIDTSRSVDQDTFLQTETTKFKKIIQDLNIAD